MRGDKVSVVVLYNLLGEDEYEKLREVDPASLPFTPEYDIHVSTALEEYGAVVRALRHEGFRARAVNLREDLPKLENLLRRKTRPDVIVNLVEYFHDDPELEPNIAALLELHCIPYTGAPAFALWLCQKKGLTKLLLLAHGVPTPRFRLLMGPRVPRRHELDYPLIVKPAREDASSGVERDSVVYDYAQLSSRLERAFDEFGAPLLVEEFIEGTELHVSLLGNDPAQVLPAIEWDLSDLPPGYPPIISYAAKWNPLAEVYHRVHSVCPARLSKRARKKVEETALRAFAATGCRDYARLDIRLGKNDRPYVLEVNPNPDLSEGVSFMESAEAAGYSFSETLRTIVEFALERRPAPLPD